MGSTVEVNSSNFTTEVLEKSYEKPVLMDFFATWCGPCKMLMPILEGLLAEYDFILAKIDIDQNPDLANTYGVEGVPDVKIAIDGQVRPGFVGVKPEPELRQILEGLNLTSELEMGLQAIQTASASGDLQQAKQLLDQLFAKYPENPHVTIAAAKFLVSLHQLEDAEKLLGTIREDDREHYRQAQAVKALIHFQQEADNPGDSELDQLYAKGCRLALAQEHDEALQIFLDIVGKSRKYKQDGARKAMLVVFGLLGDEHPLTKQYRKQLQLQLY
ncbi:MAG: tetratricopeptide repeat protein [Hormoscilla sp.]